MYFKQNIHLLIVILQLLIVTITVNMLFCSAELNNPVDPESKSYILPNAPTGVSVTAGNGQVIVTFEYPIPNGGPAVTSYTVTSTPGNIAVSGTTSPLTVTGLSNGVEYTFVVTATNVCGTSPSSVASAAIKPSTVPGTPTNVTATAGNMEAMVSFTAPATNGGSVITGYSVTSSPGGITVTGTASPLTVTGLTNGTAYTFTVKAINVNGNSLPSTASTVVTPSIVPGTPTNVTATAGNMEAIVSFTAPVTNDGSTITGYTVTSSPEGRIATGTTSPITVTGLANGTAYTFTVIATNVHGNSLPSTASAVVTPSTVPGTPTNVTATAGNMEAMLSFTAPATNGGSAITGYIATSSPGGKTATGTTSPLIVTGLTNSTAYTFTVVAINVNGNSLPSTASTAVTPSAVPGVPTNVTATAGNMEAMLSFTAPASNGGSAITGYTVTSSPEGKTVTGTTSPLTVTGLTNGIAYTFTVIAINLNGNSLPSTASAAVTPSNTAISPLFLKAINITNNTCALAWTEVVDLQNFSCYKVFKSTSSNVTENATLVTTITTATSNNYNIIGTAGVTEYFKVYVYNKAGAGSASNEVTVRYPDALKAWTLTMNTSQYGYTLSDIHSIDDNHAWAVGKKTSPSDTGIILKFNYSSRLWEREVLPAGIRDVGGIHMLSASQGYANAQCNIGGQASLAILKYDGVSWSIYRSISYAGYYRVAYDIYAVSDSVIFASYRTSLNPTELVYKITQSGWSDQGVPGLWFTFRESNDGYVFCNYYYARKYNGFGWTSMETSSYFEDMSINKNNGILYALKDGYSYYTDTLFIFNNSDQPTKKVSLNVNNSNHIFVYDDTHIWVSTEHELAFYDGTSTQNVSVAGASSFERMWFHSATSGWAIANNGIYMYR